MAPALRARDGARGAIWAWGPEEAAFAVGLVVLEPAREGTAIWPSELPVAMFQAILELPDILGAIWELKGAVFEAALVPLALELGEHRRRGGAIKARLAVRKGSPSLKVTRLPEANQLEAIRLALVSAITVGPARPDGAVVLVAVRPPVRRLALTRAVAEGALVDVGTLQL